MLTAVANDCSLGKHHGACIYKSSVMLTCASTYFFMKSRSDYGLISRLQSWNFTSSLRDDTFCLTGSKQQIFWTRRVLPFYSFATKVQKRLPTDKNAISYICTAGRHTKMLVRRSWCLWIMSSPMCIRSVEEEVATQRWPVLFQLSATLTARVYQHSANVFPQGPKNKNKNICLQNDITKWESFRLRINPLFSFWLNPPKSPSL